MSNVKYVLHKARALAHAIGMPLVLSCALFLPVIGHADTTYDYFRAVALDNQFEVASLLKKGVSPNLTEAKRGDSGLIYALREDSMQVFKLLLNAPRVDLGLRAKNGDDALMIAAWKENLPAVKALLERGVEVNRDGWTALHYAAAKGNNEIVQLLLDQQAEIDAESPSQITPLMMAAQAGHIYTVKLLYDAGADITLEDEHGRTAITFATYGGHDDIVKGLKYLLSKANQKATVQPAPMSSQMLLPARLPPMD
ncbi:MAG: ankyrin repeat domain-containing protein [Burkholderiaceae bacterium]|nr:ankyrin repeat domain-containing protein [Burkholderiaceae bacterium]